MSDPPFLTSEYYSTSDMNSFLWTIENFTECVRLNGGEFTSPTFKFKLYCPSKIESTHLRQFNSIYNVEDPIFYCEAKNLSVSISILIHGELDTSLPIEKDATNKTSWINLKDIPRSEVFGTKRSFFLPQDTMTLRIRLRDKDKYLVRPFKKLFARTVIGVQSRYFDWLIKNFSSFSSPEKKLYTLKFSPGHPQVKIQLYLTEIFKNQENYGVLLEMELEGEEKTSFVKCKVCLLDAKGNSGKYIRQEYIYKTDGNVNWRFPAFLVSKASLMADKEQLLPNDVLTLRFEFVSSIGVISNEFENEDVTFVPSLLPDAEHNIQVVEKNNLGKHLYDLYKQKKFCDATLQVEGKAFDVHKSVLCAMSPVFLAMFERYMVESQTGVVDIPDLDAETLQCMLVYMYTENIPELQWDNVYKLYYAADKYEILPLKERCSVFMVEQLNVRNVCDVLLLGDRHRDDDLKLACQKFIATSDENIINSDEFKVFEKNNAEIANETWRAIYSRNCKS